MHTDHIVFHTLRCEVDATAIEKAIKEVFLASYNWATDGQYEGPWYFDVVNTYDENGNDVPEVGYDQDEGSQWEWWAPFKVQGLDDAMWEFVPRLVPYGKDRLNCYVAERIIK